MDVEQLENAEACVKLHQANNHKKIMGYDKFVLIGFSTQPVSDSEATIRPKDLLAFLMSARNRF